MDLERIPQLMVLVRDVDGVAVHHAEAMSVLRTLPDNCIHSIVCDPQYGLSNVSTADLVTTVTAWVTGDRDLVPTGKGFMSNEWDSFIPPPAIWDECYRVLRPGGHLLSFAGTRMADLAGLSIRLAGFEIRDSIDCIGHRLSWYYGTGFPKSHNVSRSVDLSLGVDPDDEGPITEEAKQWQGWGTALKPAHEPIIVARKPLVGTVVNNVLDFETGALNIEACRVPSELRPKMDSRTTTVVAASSMSGISTGNSSSGEMTTDGRWPTNVVLNHPALFDPETGDILGDACTNGCVEGCTVLELDRQSGVTESKRTFRVDGVGDGYRGSDSAWNTERGFNDSEGASRFFPQFRWQAKAPSKERPNVDNVMHPTVKPLGLVRWLVKLVTPRNGIVLDWCAGSGTTGEAALLDGFLAILIENIDKYVPLIQQRLDSPLSD